MYIVAIDGSVCDGNAACVEGCPVTMLSTEMVNGHKKCAVSGPMSDCLGCMVCVEVCPTGAIKVTEI